MTVPQSPALIVVFGITGDLARRKLLPALYHLMRDNLLHPETRVVGVTRQHISKTEMLSSLERYSASHARPSPAALRRFSQAFELFTADLSEEKGYRILNQHLNTVERNAHQSFQRIYYLSVPPSVTDEIVNFMGVAGLAAAHRDGPLPRLLMEKPFGYDVRSARTVIKSIRQHFTEAQVYRIDHYLAKEMAQNILNFRFDNPLYEKVWTHEHIFKVVITAFEKIGIEGRVAFYEQTGALRDLLQSHLLQLMCLVAMERPANTSSRSVHAARLKLLKKVQAPLAYEVNKVARRGQYKAYRRETGGGRTNTETYAELHLSINNDRWTDVPFILRTGKALHEKITKVEIYFGDKRRSNKLELRLQPDEAAMLNLHLKQPGHEKLKIDTIMDFTYRRNFPTYPAPEAYEQVLLDAVRGDQTLFASSAEILEAWRIVQPVLREWEKSSTGLKLYDNGSKTPFPRELPLKA